MDIIKKNGHRELSSNHFCANALGEENVYISSLPQVMGKIVRQSGLSRRKKTLNSKLGAGIPKAVQHSFWHSFGDLWGNTDAKWYNTYTFLWTASIAWWEETFSMGNCYSSIQPSQVRCGNQGTDPWSLETERCNKNMIDIHY